MVATLPEDEPQPIPPTDREKVEAFTRLVIAGHERGAVRRIILYVIVGAAIIIGLAVDGAVGITVSTLGLIGLMLLAMSDNYA